MRFHRASLESFVLGALFGLTAARAENLLPNPRFDAAAGDGPASWQLADGAGRWLPEEASSPATLVAMGQGDDASTWRTGPLASIRPGQLYALRFTGRRDPGAVGGTALAGLGLVHRDFPLTSDWRDEEFIFAAPAMDVGPAARFGQWHVRGSVAFRNVELLPVLATHALGPDGSELGDGESIRDGVYQYEANLNGVASNSSRVLVTNRAGFNSNRWLFQPGVELVFRHDAGPRPLTRGRVRIAINHHTGGMLAIEASRDGIAWTPAGAFDGQRRSGELPLPEGIFPATNVWVRLVQRGDGAGFQVNTYAFEGQIGGDVADAEGFTRFLTVRRQHPDLTVRLAGLTAAEAGRGVRIALALTHRLPERARIEAHGSNLNAPDREARESLMLDPGSLNTLVLTLPVSRVGEQQFRLSLVADGQEWFSGRVAYRVGILEGPAFGHPLTGASDLDLWWCEGGWKVGRHSPAPRISGEAVSPLRVALAGGEDEPVQIVLRPNRPMNLTSVRVAGLRDTRGNPSALSVKVDEVAYVRVTQPTDESCVPGWYPDPLPPLRGSLALRAGENQPLWLTVRAPRGTAAGDHVGSVELVIDGETVRVPFVATVYGFDLPRETHLRSALGLGMESIVRYHRLSRRDDQVLVFEKYLQSFAEHRISPYSFYDHAPIQVRFEGEGAEAVAHVDFTAFDAAATRWLDEAGFNTFQLPLRGMGGGTFHSRHLGRLQGFEEGTAEHARLFRDYLGQVERHLDQRGWLSRAFTYWFDEPDPKDYEFVIAGMRRLKEAAPGIRRMLTEQPEPALLGHVDIWCGLTPEWSRERVQERRRAGEEVWWYICTAPRAPYLTEFIDHPGTELRLWPWQSWQYGVTGILVWATVYWTSPLVYPEPEVQDPWRDPMSWTSGYGLPVGHRAPWGNGDGRFLYPPRRDPNTAREANLDAPIHSSRWENLRDGMEDYEYLWLLDAEVRRLEGRNPAPAEWNDARGLLDIPASVSTDLTRFTTDPGDILAHRERVARAIERLRAIR